MEWLGNEIGRTVGDQFGRQVQTIGAVGGHDDHRQLIGILLAAGLAKKVDAEFLCRPTMIWFGRDLKIKQDVVDRT